MKQSMTYSMACKAALAAFCCACLSQPAAAQTQAAPAQTPQQQRAASAEQAAATARQAQKTEHANRAAGVEDETSTAAQAARTAQAETRQFEAAQGRRDPAGAAPSYGPVLAPRGQPASDAQRKDPAEVHDETDSLTRQAPLQTPAQNPAQSQRPQSSVPRHPASQVNEPMAPRPLRQLDGAAVTGLLPTPTGPVAAARPSPAPTTGLINSCQGSSCLDTGGNSINGLGSGNAGVNASGRLCTRTGGTVQCF